MPVRVQIARVGTTGAKFDLPAYATAGAAGVDLAAALDEPITIAPMGRALVGTGIAVALPSGFEGQVRPRSGLAWKRGVTILNAPGTIDSDYRGEIKVILVNLGAAPVIVVPGERIAQLIVAAVERAEWETRDALDGTARGAGGFGHTGQ